MINKGYTTWRLMISCLLIILFMLLSKSSAGQTYTCDEDICVVEFNASWNEKNNVDWLHDLTDVETKRILIDKGSWQKEFGIVVAPTIIIFVNGKEVKRFQACLRFKMGATQEEVQDKIDEIIMEL
tara:strand:+ start:115 stop:492 length:378 start_codon:yes stop_codon:yes gene_type:complete